jgi:hypothetical protein
MSDTKSTTEQKVGHTPGPWTHEQGTLEGQKQSYWNVDGAPEPFRLDDGTLCDPFARGVCMVYSHEGAGEANTHLIAAAPTMLAALYEVAHHADDECGFMADVRAAIAKAEGRS